MSRIEQECEEILRKLIANNAFLQPANPNFDIWDAQDAKKVLADLIIEINSSNEIQDAHSKKDWGK